MLTISSLTPAALAIFTNVHNALCRLVARRRSTSLNWQARPRVGDLRARVSGFWRFRRNSLCVAASLQHNPPMLGRSLALLSVLAASTVARADDAPYV